MGKGRRGEPQRFLKSYGRKIKASEKSRFVCGGVHRIEELRERNFPSFFEIRFRIDHTNVDG